MRIFTVIKRGHLTQLHTLVKKYNMRWVDNPSDAPDNMLYVNIDYNYDNNTLEQIRAFDLAWYRMKTPIKEMVRDQSILGKIKRKFKSMFKL